jgi:hypothetical protein
MREEKKSQLTRGIRHTEKKAHREEKTRRHVSEVCDKNNNRKAKEAKMVLKQR